MVNWLKKTMATFVMDQAVSFLVQRAQACICQCFEYVNLFRIDAIPNEQHVVLIILYGFKAEEQYSNIGLTSGWFSLSFNDRVGKFRCKKPRVLFPFDVTLNLLVPFEAM